MADRPLTIKQKTYVEGILQGLSGVKACAAAGYKGNETTLANVAAQNYRKLYIKDEIDRRRAELEAKTEYSVNKWLTTTLEDYRQAAEAKQWGAVASLKRLLGQHIGALEADKDRGTTQLTVNIANQQALIDEAIALGRALDNAPDAMAK